MRDAIDTWLKFDSDSEEMPTLEANTLLTDTGYRIEWYHVDVGQVTPVEFDTLSDAYDWYERNGFKNFTA